MNLGSIYDVAMFHIYGETTPPAIVQSRLQAAAEGVISNIHRAIQEDYNYWFMEMSGTLALIPGTTALTLPTGFKEEYQDGFYITDPTSGYFVKPLYKIQTSQAVIDYPDRTSVTGAYPKKYSLIYTSGTGRQIEVYPTSGITATLNVHYYGYLTRPTVFTTHEDALTDEASNLIIYRTVVEMEKSLENSAAKIASFTQMAMEEEMRLMNKDVQIRLGNNTRLGYVEV